MDIFVAVAFSLVAAILLVTIREIKKEYAIVLSVCTGAVMLLWMLGQIVPVLDQLSRFLQSTKLELAYQEILLKTLGISFLAQLGCDCCKDAGESAIATKLELCAKIAIVLISLPMFSEVLNIAASMFTI